MQLQPIKIKADPTTREAYVQNIMATAMRATADQYARGVNWYPTARDLALFIANGDLRMGSAVIAALSANNGWTMNQRLAADACAGNVHGHTDDTLDKVRRILAGVDPVDVLPMTKKTGNFFRNILDPTDPVSVTIDRHAHDLAVGVKYGSQNRLLSAPGRYNMLADCYREAARRLGMLPSVLQAITWLVWIES